MHWFGAEERGFALGVRQTAIPLGGFIGALSPPSIADAAGTDAAFLFLAALSAIGALVGALVLRGARFGRDRGVLDRATIADGSGSGCRLGSSSSCTPRSRCWGSAFFLVDEHGLSGRSAALVFAGSQVLGGAFRIGGGRWSDRIGARASRRCDQSGLGIVGVMTLTAVRRRPDLARTSSASQAG